MGKEWKRLDCCSCGYIWCPNKTSKPVGQSPTGRYVHLAHFLDDHFSCLDQGIPGRGSCEQGMGADLHRQ